MDNEAGTSNNTIELVAQLIEVGFELAEELMVKPDGLPATLFTLELSDRGKYRIDAMIGIAMPFGGSEAQVLQLATKSLAETSMRIGLLVSKGSFRGKDAAFLSIHLAGEPEAWSFARQFTRKRFPKRTVVYLDGYHPLDSLPCGFPSSDGTPSLLLAPKTDLGFEVDATVASTAKTSAKFFEEHVERMFDQHLDYSEESVALVERIADSLHCEYLEAQPEPEVAEAMFMMVGCYLGEVARRAHGFEWGLFTDYETNYALRINEFGAITPIVWAASRIIEGPPHSLLSKYEQLVRGKQDLLLTHKERAELLVALNN